MYVNNDHKQFFLLPHGGAVADNHFKLMSVFILIWSHNMWSFIYVKQCMVNLWDISHSPVILVKFNATPFSYFTTYQKIHVDLTSVPSWHHLYQISSKSNVQCISSISKHFILLPHGGAMSDSNLSYMIQNNMWNFTRVKRCIMNWWHILASKIRR